MSRAIAENIINDSSLIRDIAAKLYADTGADNAGNLPTIVLSEDTPVTERGRFDDDDIRRKLRKATDRLVNDWGPNTMEVIGDSHYSVDDIAGSVLVGKYGIFDEPRSNMPPEIRRFLDEAEETLFHRKMTFLTCAEYDRTRNLITVYYKNIEKVIENRSNVTFEDELISTLAHELFHAAHSKLAPKTYGLSLYEAEVVKEALAEYFAYMYCMDKDKKDVAQASRYRWKKNRIFDDPYANAIYVEYEGYDWRYNYPKDLEMVDKFKQVLDESKSDMVQAYETLVPDIYRHHPDHYNPPVIRGRRPRNGVRRGKKASGQTHFTNVFRYEFWGGTWNAGLKRSIVLFRDSDEVTVDDRNMHGSFTADSVLIDTFFYMIEQLDWQKDRDNYGLVFDSSSWTVSLYNADGTKEEIRGNIEESVNKDIINRFLKMIFEEANITPIFQI